MIKLFHRLKKLDLKVYHSKSLDRDLVKESWKLEPFVGIFSGETLW